MKVHHHKEKSSLRSQAGVTLMLALLVLSSIMAISFSIASILLVEIKSSGDLTRTEPALYASEAFSEQALFNTIRQTNVSVVGNSNIGNIGVVTSTSTLSSPIQEVVIPADSNTATNTESVYPLYNPANPSGGSGYGRLTINLVNMQGNTGPVYIYICQWNPAIDSSASCGDPTNPNPPSDLSWCPASPNPPAQLTTASPSFDSNAACGSFFNSSDQQELIMYQGANADTRVEIEGYDSTGTTPKGIPYFGQTVVNVSGTNAGVTRAIQTIIPNP